MQVLLVVPRVFRASRVVSGLAAVCARGRRPARSPSAPRASLGASSRSPARPRHRPRAPQPGPPVPPAPSTPVTPVADMRLGASTRYPARPRHPPAPQPSLNESFRPCARSHQHHEQAHQSLRCPPRQALTPLTPAPTTNFARNSPSTLSNFEFRTLELQRFQSSLKLLPIELRASFLEGRP